jgi:hypothetical protein
MDAMLTIEPFGFFTLDSLRAGWYLIWRQLVRVLPVVIVAIAVGAVCGKVGMTVLGVLVVALGIVAAAIWAAVLIPRLTSRWAETRYGYALTGLVGVWWGISWRAWLAAMVAAVIFTPPNFVALSLSTAFPHSALGALGQLMAMLLGLGNFAATVLATGWAMSKVTAAQLSGMPVPSPAIDPMPVASPAAPVAVSTDAAPSAARAPLATPAAPPAATLTAPAPAPAAGTGRTDGKRQCPKCGLYETERGTVIGWYCTVCGWREARR